jgi:hypothetical protein
MAGQLDSFEIELPSGISESELQSLQQELGKIQGVEQCGLNTTRALDPVSLSVWFVLAKHALAAVGGAAPVIKAIADLFKSRGIKGVKLVLADGSTFQADEISVSDLLKIEQSAKSSA